MSMASDPPLALVVAARQCDRQHHPAGDAQIRTPAPFPTAAASGVRDTRSRPTKSRRSEPMVRPNCSGTSAYSTATSVAAQLIPIPYADASMWNTMLARWGDTIEGHRVDNISKLSFTDE
jgi:hypothetical protein